MSGVCLCACCSIATTGWVIAMDGSSFPKLVPMVDMAP
jgi:hypothetical protein